MRLTIAFGIPVAAIICASSIVANANVESVDYLVARDFEELESRRGGGATGGGHGGAAAAAARNRPKPKPKPKDRKRKLKKPKRSKECGNGNGPIESRALDELIERRDLLGILAKHLRCPGEEHHAREFLEELMERQLDSEEGDSYEARSKPSYFDAYEARDLQDYEDTF